VKQTQICYPVPSSLTVKTTPPQPPAQSTLQLSDIVQTVAQVQADLILLRDGEVVLYKRERRGRGIRLMLSFNARLDKH